MKISSSYFLLFISDTNYHVFGFRVYSGQEPSQSRRAAGLPPCHNQRKIFIYTKENQTHYIGAQRKEGTNRALRISTENKNKKKLYFIFFQSFLTFSFLTWHIVTVSHRSLCYVSYPGIYWEM